MRANRHAVIISTGLVAASVWLSAAQAGELTVTATAGQVTLSEHGHSVPPVVGAKFALPVEIHTGSDGSVDVQQLGSSLHVGPNSTVAVPDVAAPGNAVDKIRQSAGYVLYNIKSRKDHPLAVETPYLVSVVKGTVFSIAVEGHATTVALMEGSLDISAPGVADHVLLKPNQSIRHAEGESQLSVRSSASAGVTPGTPMRAGASLVLPDATQSGQMAQVARDLASAGAAVAAGHAIATHQAILSNGAGGIPAGGTASSGGTSSGSSASGGPGSANTGGLPGTGSGSSSGSGSGSAGTGSTAGTGGSTGTGGSSNTGGGSVTLPPTGSGGGSTPGTGNCNGKNNSTGSGNCYGHNK
jgi:FecR protein